MTSVEKRRSRRKSSGHRKHSDGGFSDASSGGSFLDETDREVSNLTDRAFRSLCIGDEAVYNDTELTLTSPIVHSERQLAFCRDSDEREREGRQRAPHENFNLRMQEYGQDGFTGAMYGAEIHRDAQWEAFGERTQRMGSTTFQHSLVETSHLDKSLNEEGLSFLGNGDTEFSSQQRRSHSRVSSLIRAFNSDGNRDGVGIDDKIKKRDDGTGWDKSALMSIQTELSEFSYQQNLNHHIHSAWPFSYRDSNFCFSEAETMAQVSHSYMRSSESKHSMSAQVNCSSNFFIHSEFSPFKLWRDYNRFSFQQAEPSGFLHCSEFPKWYQTPMYNELSLENQSHGHYGDIRHQRSHLGYSVPLMAPRSISTSSQFQRASAVEKRCESELAVYHPHRRWTGSRLGNSKLLSHRPTTASPSTEMSQRVRDTISSVKALQHKVKMMSEHETTNQQEVISKNESWIHSRNSALSVERNFVSSNTENSFRFGQLLTPSVHQHQELETSCLRQHEVSQQPVEHPPVQGESRGATPDVRMSRYKSRATSLLFNLKDNRKRVKSTYSPTMFKSLDKSDKSQQPSLQESHDAVVTGSDFQCLQPEAPSRANTAVNQCQTPGKSLTNLTSHPARVNTGQYPENAASDYLAAQRQGHMANDSVFSGFMPSDYSNNQLAGNGWNHNKNLASFTPYSQDIYGSAGEVSSYSDVGTARLNVDNNQQSQHILGKSHVEQVFNETKGGLFIRAEQCEQVTENKNVSCNDKWRQTSSQDTENALLKNNVFPVKQEQENLHGQKKDQVKISSLPHNCNRFTNQYDGRQQNIYLATQKSMNVKTGQTEQNILVPNEKILTKHQFEKKTPKFILGNASTVTTTNWVKNIQILDTESKQVLESNNKQQYPQVELAKTQEMAHVERSKTESAGFLLSGQIGLETVKITESKSEPTEQQNMRQVKDVHINKEEKRNVEHKDKPRNKCFQQEEGKQMKAEREMVFRLIDDPTNVTEKVPKKLKTEQAEMENLKQEHIKTELAKTEASEWVSINQVTQEKAKGMQAEEKRRSTEKVEGLQIDAEEIRTEKVKAERIRDEQREQINELQIETIDLKRMTLEASEVKTNHIKVEDVNEARAVRDSIQERHIISEWGTSAKCNTEDTKREKEKLRENLKQKESGLSKTENLLERSAKLTANLAATHQIRQEPDRLVQVKTELAKAKAELTKIKEKTRGDQKEKVRSILFTKDLKDDSPINMTVNKNTSNKKQSHAFKIQTHAVTDDYERLREKYGFTHAASTNSNTESLIETVPVNVIKETEDKFSNPETENKEGVKTFKHSEETKSQSDQNDPLSQAQVASLPASLCEKANGENEKLTDDSDHNLENSDVNKGTSSLQKDSLSGKHERKSTDLCISKGKYMAATPLRDLLQKEKAQTKQEILTSKIKAHAEKEISAIKEKRFALTEGFIGKNSAKQLVGGQSVKIRQQPSSQEVPKKQRSTVTNKITPKHQVEPSGVQTDSPNLASSLGSDKVSWGTGADNLEKLTKMIKTTGTIESTTERCIQKEQTDVSPTETPGKHNCVKPLVVNNEAPTKTAEDLAQTTKTLIPVTTENTETIEKTHKESGLADCVNYRDSSVKDDGVQIMGIMVTVVERTDDTDPQNNNDVKQVNAAEIESIKSDSGRENPSQEEEEVLVTENNPKQSQSMVKKDEVSLAKINHLGNVQEVLSSEVINKEMAAKNVEVMFNSSTTNSELLMKQSREAVAVSAKDKLLAKTQQVAHQMDTTLKETNDVTVNMNENLSKSSGQTKTGDAESQHEMQNPLPAKVYCDKINKDENQLFEGNLMTSKTLPESSSKDEQCALISEDKICSTSPILFDNSAMNESKHVSQNLQSNNTYFEEHGQEDTSVHIDNISIRVVTAEGKKDNVELLDKCETNTIPSNEKSVNEKQHFPTSSNEGKAQISNDVHHFENWLDASNGQKLKNSPEEKLAVQDVLSSVKKLSDSMKASDKQNNTNITRECIKAEQKQSDSSVQLREADYFQVQGPAVTSNMSPNNITVKKDSKQKDILRFLPSETCICNKLHKEQKSDIFVFTVDPSERKQDQPSITINDGENLKSINLETEDNKVASKLTCGSMENWIEHKRGEEGKSHPIIKHKEEDQCCSGPTERQSSTNKKIPNTNLTRENPEVKSNSKIRVSAIPEISAIADYARLKVIVSEDKEVQPGQQFPPNKKEGFFPVIQSRHSRRPVYIDDPQDLFVKAQGLLNKTALSAIVNKEPKPLVFPIMEKEHQRTGMFKLGDKESQEKMTLNAKRNMCKSDNDLNQTYTNKSLTAEAELHTQLGEEHQGRTVEEEQWMRVAHNEQQGTAIEEQQRKIAEEEERRRVAHKEKQKREVEEQRMMSEEAERREKVLQDEQQRITMEEQQRRIAVKEQKRKIAQEPLQINSVEEQQRRATQLEEQRRIGVLGQKTKSTHEEQQKIEEEEQKSRHAQMEQQRRIAEEEQQSKAEHEEQQNTESKEQRCRAKQTELYWRVSEEKQQCKVVQEEQQHGQLEEQQRTVAQEEQEKRKAKEQQSRAGQTEPHRKIAEEQQQWKAAHEKQQRKAAEEQQRTIAEEEQQRKNANKEQQRREAKEQQSKAKQIELHRRIAEEEQQNEAVHEEQKRKAAVEHHRRIAEEEQQNKVVHEEEQKRKAEEQQRGAEQIELNWIAEEQQQRKNAHEQQQKREYKEQQSRVKQMKLHSRIPEEEQQNKTMHEEQQRKAAEEHHRSIAEEEQSWNSANEEQQRRTVEELQKRIAEGEKSRKGAYEEQSGGVNEEQMKNVQFEQQMRLAEEQPIRRDAHKQQQRREAEEQHRGIAEDEQQRKALDEEQQRIAAEEQHRRTAQVEQQRTLEQQEQRVQYVYNKQKIREAEDQQRRIAEEEEQQKGSHEEQQKSEAKELQRRSEQIECHWSIAKDKQLRKALHAEQHGRSINENLRGALLEQQRSISEAEQQGKAAHKEQHLEAVQEQHRTGSQVEQQKRPREISQMREAAHEEQQRRTLHGHHRDADEQKSKSTEQKKQGKDLQFKQREELHKLQRATSQEDNQERVEEPQRRVTQADKSSMLSSVEQKKSVVAEQERTGTQEEQKRRVAWKEQQNNHVEENRKTFAQEKQQRIASLIEEQRQVKQVQRQIVNCQNDEAGEGINVAHMSEMESVKQMQKLNKMQHLTEELMNERFEEKEKTTLKKMLENINRYDEKEITKEQREEQQLILTKTDKDNEAKKIEDDKQEESFKKKSTFNHQKIEKRKDQKTDALQYFAITSTNKERKPREIQFSSPLPLQQQSKKQMELESPNDLLYHTRPYRSHAAASPAPSLPRSNTSSPALGAKPLMFRVKDNTIRGSSLTKSVKPHFHKNFGEDFLMGSKLDGGCDKLEHDYEIIKRNAGTPIKGSAAISEAASFLLASSSQDYSNSTTHLRPYSRRSMAMDDDESRSVISNMSEDVESFTSRAADLTDMHGLFDCDRPESACSFSSDLSRSLGKPPAVPPKSEKASRRAQRLTSRRIKKELSKATEGNPAGVGKEVSSVPSSSSSFNEVCSSNHYAVASPHFSPPVAFALAPAVGSTVHSFHASPHTSGPISIPNCSPHSANVVSLHTSSHCSKPASLQTVAHIPPSSTLHHVNHPATPVTQYHLESTNYPRSYPLTQRKVLQDLGSGQYFVVDVPVQVQTKTFFDPETGKYVQLNVRETSQNISQPHIEQTYQQPQIQPQPQVKQQQPSLASVPSVASKPFRFYQGYHSFPQNYQTAVFNSAHRRSSSVPVNLQQNQQVLRESLSSGHAVAEVDQNSEGHCYSPEKTPYMDTVNDTTKTYNTTQDSLLESEKNSQLGRSSVCDNDHSANSDYQPRDIIPISELDDFMEVSDW